MRARTIVVGCMIAAAAPSFAACDRSPAVLIDWGLHRQWRVERDCEHPARPAELAEIPWNDAAAKADQPLIATGSGHLAPSWSHPLLIRPGTRVVVVAEQRNAEMRLSGVALAGGTLGATIPVWSWYRGATLRGIVRGPALVELVPEKGRN